MAQRVLARAQKRLERGEALVWVGEKGPPLWHRLVAGEGAAVLSRNASEPFRVSTMSTALVELLPRLPPGGCRVEFQVWQREGATIGLVGDKRPKVLKA